MTARTDTAFTDLVQPFIEQRVIAGAVTLVADHERVLDLGAHGMADLATGEPMAADTVFWIASQTKPFTGTALMMLVEEGKVNVDDPVEKYLPEFEGQMVLVEADDAHRLLRHPRHPITVRNVLTHTGGMPYAAPIEIPSIDLLPLGTAVRSYATLPLLCEPDTRYLYSNAGTNVVGRLIEVVSGMSYEAFLHARLIEPLGLRDTTFWSDADQRRRLAKSYRQETKESPLEECPITMLHQADLTDRVRRHAVPAAGLFSTAVDCSRLCRMISRRGELDGRRYLSEASVELMTTRQEPATVEEPGEYGFGWSTAHGRIGHGGAYSTGMFIDRRTGLTMVFLTQHAGFDGEVTRLSDAFWKAAVEKFGAGMAR